MDCDGRMTRSRTETVRQLRDRITDIVGRRGPLDVRKRTELVTEIMAAAAESLTEADRTTENDDGDDLPDYSGGVVNCAACGFDRASVQFRSSVFSGMSDIHPDGELCGGGDTLGKLNPRLHRECDRCGYEWDEKPLN